MKRIILINGIIAGIVVSSAMLVNMVFCGDLDMEVGMLIGYTSMLLSFSLIFVAIRNYRNNINGGHITFGKGLQIGLLITLIASTFYVVSWLIDFFVFNPDFLDKYDAKMLEKLKTSGLGAEEIKKQTEEMQKFGDMYKNNPLFTAAVTYMEILPVGIVVSLIAALVLKRKPKSD